MRTDNCLDKDKLRPHGVGSGDFDGKPIRRQRGMIYWYRWGRHTFDIRELRKLLGLPEEHEADQFFMEGNAYWNRESAALTAIAESLKGAMGQRTFKSLMKEHDAALRADGQEVRR